MIMISTARTMFLSILSFGYIEILRPIMAMFGADTTSQSFRLCTPFLIMLHDCSPVIVLWLDEVREILGAWLGPFRGCKIINVRLFDIVEVGTRHTVDVVRSDILHHVAAATLAASSQRAISGNLMTTISAPFPTPSLPYRLTVIHLTL